MRLIAALGFAGVLLTGAAPPTEADLQRAADRLIATSDIPAVITLVEQDGKRTVVASGDAEIGAQEGSSRRPLLGREHHEELRRDGGHAARRRAQAPPRRPRQHAAPGTPSRRAEDPPAEPAQPHERDSGLHAARAVEQRGRAQSTRRDLPAAPRLVGGGAPARVPAGKPGVVLEHELPRARGDPRARHRAARWPGCCGNESSSRSASRDGVRERRRTVGGDQIHGYDVSGTRPTRRLAARARRARGPTARSCRTRATSRCSSSRCCAAGSSRRGSSRRCRRSCPARTARAWGCTGSRRRAAAGSTGTRAARPATSRSPQAPRRAPHLRRRLERRRPGRDRRDGPLPRRARLPALDNGASRIAAARSSRAAASRHWACTLGVRQPVFFQK